MSSFRLYSGMSDLLCRKTWAEIDTDALQKNYRSLSTVSPDARHICVVKADAYGHTSRICVPALLSAGCDFFAVSCIEEAIEVREICRQQSKDADILILGYTDCRMASVISEYDVIQTVISADYAIELERAAKEEGCRVRVHVALDTGMNRIGLCTRKSSECQDAAAFIKTLVASESLCVEGMFTHFARADEDLDISDGANFTKEQFDRFSLVREELKRDGIELFCHVCNSAATVRFPELSLDGVRLGILLYGVAPSEFVTADVSPVISLFTVISHIHTLPEGERVSYGGIFHAEEERVIATLPIGYADGFLRAYSGAEVTVCTQNGEFKAPVIGRVCMDQCMIDVTDVPARVGDRIRLFGRSSDELTRLAKMADTIEYETLCLISGRVPRIEKER